MAFMLCIAIIILQSRICVVQGPLLASRGIETASEVIVNLLSTHDQPTTLFSPQCFFQHLDTRSQGSVLLTSTALPSTQTLLQDNPGHFLNGTVCVADRQIKGRGALIT